MRGFYNIENNNFFDSFLFEEPKKQVKKINDCYTCGLFTNCKSPKMAPTGEGKKKILIIAEAPGRMEDDKGKQLVGEIGKYFRKKLNEIGYKLDRDFWKTNAVICRPPENRKPTKKEIDACKINIYKTIEKYRPKGIILLGVSAFESLIGDKISKHLQRHSFNNFVGKCIPDQDLKMWIGVLYHPSYIVRMDDITLEKIWLNDLKNIIEQCEKPFYIHNYKSDIFITKEVDQAKKWLKELINTAEIIAEDFETTGIKPHKKGHEIKTIAISDGIFSYAFPNFDDKEFREMFKEIQKKNIVKIAHNFRFEAMWNKIIFNYNIIGKYFDTMIAAHCYKNNQKRIGLKFLSYIYFGILGYDENIEKWIKKKRKGELEKSDNSFNMIDRADLDELLLYNGFDSLLCCKLYNFYKSELNDNQFKGFELLNEGSYYLMEAQNKGIMIDLDLLNRRKKEVNDMINEIGKKLENAKELKNWDGRKKFNFNSSKDFTHLIKNILGKKFDGGLLTDTGEFKRDKKVLHKYKLSFTDDLLLFKRWSKGLDYIEQIEREIVDGKIHPFFNLHNIISFRSSSSSFNFQNIPKHDKEQKKMIRELVIPRKGNRLIEYDYKQLEVIIGTCYHKDKMLINYILNPESDMHKDQAKLLFMKDEIDSVERFVAKNDFVFAEFYGDYYKKIAPNLWEHMPKYTKNNLKEYGIRNYFDFEEHVKQVEVALWERFSGYADWKKRMLKKYEKKGYIESYTGFRYYGPMKRNELCNYPIQGSAFHCLLWTFIQVAKEIKKLKIKKSFFIGQIHDAAVGDIYLEDENVFDRLMFEYGTKKIREYWDWIILPLKIEKERSKIDGNWYEMENCGVLKYE